LKPWRSTKYGAIAPTRVPDATGARSFPAKPGAVAASSGSLQPSDDRSSRFMPAPSP
jgi:hypothetical protein